MRFARNEFAEMNKKIYSSIVACIAVVALGSNAAFASTPYDWSPITVDQITIEPHESYLLPDEMLFRSDLSSELADALDDNEFHIWNDVVDGQLPYQPVECSNQMIDTPDSSGDSVISCDPFELVNELDEPTGLEATPELRVWSDKALSRYVVTIENTTENPIEYSWEWYIDFGSGDARYATSSEFPYSWVEDQFELIESELVQEGAHWSMSPGDPSVDWIRDLPSTIAWGNVFGGSGVENMSFDNDDVFMWNDNDDEQGQLTLAAGESISFAVFNYTVDMTEYYDTEDLTGEIPIANFDAVMEGLFRASTEVFGGSGSGLIIGETAVPCDELFVGVNSTEIANWDCTTSETPETTPVAAPAPTLAKTGASIDWIVPLGVMAAIVGTGFLSISRRKRTA